MNGSLWNWLYDRFPKWCPTSEKALENAERDILSLVKHPYSLKFVDIELNEGETYTIRTLTINEDDEEARKNVPLVLLHGLGGGIGLWVMNLDSLAHNRVVYAIDVLGFGRSSRPAFFGTASDVEDMLVDSVELWSRQMNLKSFIFLGHSMGAYICVSYSMKYPEKIVHLVLVDPWGFPEQSKAIVQHQRTTFYNMVIRILHEYFNPYAALRFAGPFGPTVIRKMRPDVLEKFRPVTNDLEIVSSYLYHCNAQTPSGEVAFKMMSKPFGWALHPLINRFNVDKNIPITFIYGSKSFIDSNTGFKIKAMRNGSEVDVIVIQDADHFLYASKPIEFNATMKCVCEKIDKRLCKL